MSKHNGRNVCERMTRRKKERDRGRRRKRREGGGGSGRFFSRRELRYCRFAMRAISRASSRVDRAKKGRFAGERA